LKTKDTGKNENLCNCSPGKMQLVCQCSVQNNGTKFTQHRKTNLQQRYDIRQVCDRFTIKMRFTKNSTKNLRETYDKMYDSSLAVMRQHQVCTQ